MYFAFSRLIWATILNLIYEKLTLRRLKKIKEKDKNYKEKIQELYKKDNSGKFVQFYKSSEKNYRNKNLFISNMQLSNN